MTTVFSGGGPIVAASLLLFMAACSGGDDHKSAGTGTTTRGDSASTAETGSASGTTADAATTGEPESNPELEEMAAAQQCVDAWHLRKNNPARASFFLASGGRGLRRVSVGFAKGGACLISFAGNNGILIQVIEVNPPSAQFTGLWPPGRVENFDPSPVGWNASANAHGYVTLKRDGPGPKPLEHSVDSSVFPNVGEEEIMTAIPDEGWECHRADEHSRGSIEAVLCDATPRISVRYESFPSRAALDDAYWGYFRDNAERHVTPGTNCVRTEFGEGGFGPRRGQVVGRIFCYASSKGRAALVWKHDRLLILAYAVGGTHGRLVRWWMSAAGGLTG